MLQFAGVHDRHLLRDPRTRDIGLRPAQLAKRGRSRFGVAGHAGGRGQHPVRADEIGPLTDGLARQPHRLVVIARDELRIGGNARKYRREWVARAQAQCTAGRPVGLLPAAGKAIKALSQ